MLMRVIMNVLQKKNGLSYQYQKSVNYIVSGTPLSYIDPEVKRSEDKVTGLAGAN